MELEAVTAERRIRDARQDANAFIEYVLTDQNGEPLRQQWFHREWQRAFDQYGRVLIEAARYHGKTEQTAVGRVLYELGRNPEMRIKIVCQSDGRAIERLQQVSENIERNERLQSVFPHLKPQENRDWTKHKLTVRRKSMSKDVSVEAVGITSSVTGGRADLLIADDVVDYRNAIQMPQSREAIKATWKSVWTNLLGDDGRIIYICTPWHQADLTAELKKNPTYHPLSYSIPDDLTPLWPEMWSREALARRKAEIGSHEFARAFGCKALSDKDTPIKSEWIRFFRHLPGNIVATIKTCDPALKKGDANDYAPILTWVITDSWDLYLTRLTHERFTFPDLCRRIVQESREDDPALIAIEGIGGFGAVAQQLIDTTPLPVHDVARCPDKFLKAAEVGVFAENGHLYLPGESGRVDPRFQIVFDELTLFPVAAHDDTMDATWLAVKVVREHFQQPEELFMVTQPRIDGEIDFGYGLEL